MKSSVFTTGLAVALIAMVIDFTGCIRRQVYAPLPLAQSQFVPTAPLGSESPDADGVVASGGSNLNGAENFEVLSPARAAELAVFNQPALRTIRAERGLASAQIIQAGILSNPQLSASFDSPAFGATADTTTGDAESLGWDISQVRPRRAKLDSAACNAAAVDMEIVWREWQFAQAARQSIFDLVALENQRKALVEGLELLEENLNAVAKAVDEGNLTIVDLSAAQSAAISTRATALAVEQEINQQYVVINRALGRVPGTPISVDASMQFPDEITLPIDEELFSMVESRPDLQSVRRTYDSQEAALRAAIAAQIPTTSVSVTRAMDTSAVGTLGAGVSIDLQLFDRNQGQIANECALRNKILEQYNEQVFTARAEVDAALVDIHSLEKQIATTQQAIPLFEQLVATYDKAVKDSNANVLVYYLAFNDLIQQRVDLWRLRRQLRDAIIALETAIGSTLDLP